MSYFLSDYNFTTTNYSILIFFQQIYFNKNENDATKVANFKFYKESA